MLATFVDKNTIAHLDLSSNRMTSVGMSSLLRVGSTTSKLDKLVLRRNQIRDDAHACLKQYIVGCYLEQIPR